MNINELQSFIEPLNSRQVSELGQIAAQNLLYLPDDLSDHEIQALPDGSWVLSRDGNYHQDVKNIKTPMRSNSKEIIIALRYIAQHQLDRFDNRDKSPDVIEEWRREFHDIKFTEDERKELRSIEDALTNEIITRVSLSDPFKVHTNEDETFSIRMFSVPLEGLESIRHKKVADVLLLSLYLQQLPTEY